MTTKKREYEKPSMQAFELKQQSQLLAGSNSAPNSASIDAYQGGDFSWED